VVAPRRGLAMQSGYLAALVVGSLLLAACAPGAAPTASAGPGSQAAANPVASGQSEGAQGGAAAEWDRVVAAAKREGKLVIVGQVGADVREALTQDFQRRFPEIQVEYNSMRGAEIAAKLPTERQAGQYLVDLAVTGTTSQLDLMDANVLDPIQPYLVGPETLDRSKWLGGKLDFADNAEKFNVVMISGVNLPIAYNPTLVSSSELKSYKDVLDPKWRGKVSMVDPRMAGSGLAAATFFYGTPSLGKEFLANLFAAGVVFSRDLRQPLEWLARGQYPVSLGPSAFEAVELRQKGLPIELLGADAVEESSYLTASWGSVAVVNRPPHPNAAKVYLNWLLSRDGQTEVSKANGHPSRRLDVSTDHLLHQSAIPKPSAQYQENYKEPYVRMRDEVVDFLKSVSRN
jgi:iron(III) transport system substrate-binding protein